MPDLSVGQPDYCPTVLVCYQAHDHYFLPLELPSCNIPALIFLHLVTRIPLRFPIPSLLLLLFCPGAEFCYAETGYVLVGVLMLDSLFDGLNSNKTSR